MKILSILNDGRINARNVLIEMTIEEYLVVGEQILQKNEFQRNKVKRSSSVYSLLRKDLKQNCTFPPIVLALSSEKAIELKIKENLNDEDLKSFFKYQNLIILDGLQRTYNLKEVKDEFRKSNEEENLNNYLKNRIRVEIYIGINKIGILYRMLTLNTGQTPMSVRHQIEILYSDYININIPNIKFFKEVDETVNRKLGEYQFRDVIEGFNSYLDRDESGIDRSEILDNIQNLEKLSTENSESDLFIDYICSFDKFIRKIDNLTNGWKYDPDLLLPEKLDSIFGKDILRLFNKPQVLSAFGAAIGKLKDNGTINSFDEISNSIDNIKLTTEDIDICMNKYLIIFDKIKKNARKIGVEQRSYLKFFFSYLFNPNSDSYLLFDDTIAESYKRYSSLL